MDPNACLLRILDAARDNDRAEYVAACRDLADWLAAGGFAPSVPEGTRFIPGTNTMWALLSPMRPGECYELVRYDRRGDRAEVYRLS